jgi:GR25 family glycosyltransferase involved in LPS biosynthesis
MSIALNMIVRNEEEVIINTLNNLSQYINFDYWVICDTGSTDKTKELIINYFKEKNIPGELICNEWKDFGHNRSLALEHVYNKSDYVFIFDADDSIEGNFKLPECLKDDLYNLNFGKDFKYVRPLLLNNRKKWMFKGVLHEYLCGIESNNTTSILEGNYYIVHGTSGFRSQNKNKYLDDALVLEKAFIEEKDTSLKNRYAFYCAQSYKDCNQKEKSIEWYTKVLTLNNWSQEKYYSCLMLFTLSGDIKYAYKSVEYDSERMEGIIMAIKKLYSESNHIVINALYHKYKNYKKKDMKNKLFVMMPYYNYELEYYNCISAYYVNDHESGYECCKNILISSNINYNIKKRVLNNLCFYKNYIQEDIFHQIDNFYKEMFDKNETIEKNHIELWELLFNNTKNNLTKYQKYNFINKKNPVIMITFTTCKRLDLFKQTINSILNTWLDIDKIDYWFCVDDNSCENDRNEMTHLYDWIDYYMKPLLEKGHRQSMNIIWNKLNELKPKYWIHMEDDFLFYNKTNYVEESIQGLEELKEFNVKQILFNINYGETIKCYNCRGHITKGKYALHDHKNGEYSYSNHHYWPHYSFRPSMILTETVLSLGDFSSENVFFEMDYAKKWNMNGYKSGFFNKLTNRHIGKLTHEKNKENSYSLNNESQFVNNNFIKIVNLERRFDRKQKVIENLQKENIVDYEFIKAVDGKTLKSSYELSKMFKKNDFGSRRSFIGCALSHINLWKNLLEDKNNDYYLILEDDITFCQNIKKKINDIQSKITNIDILFLGYHMYKNKRDTNIYDVESENYTVHLLNKSLYIGGTFSYFITKNGAKKMLDYIEKNGVQHGIDYVIKINDNVNCYETQPLLFFSKWNEDSEVIDSDIQYDNTSILFNEDEFIFIPYQDQLGNDMYYKKDSIVNLMDEAIKDKNCVGFNTLGFFKNKIESLCCSSYFSKTDGIYIKKEEYKKYIDNKKFIRIKLIANWTSSKNVCNEFSNMCDNQELFSWKNIQITWEDKDIDYYVIINYPNQNEYYDPKKTIVFQMEPYVHDKDKNWGVKTWGKWENPTDFLEVRGRHTEHNNIAFWQLELTLNEIKDLKIEKMNKISSICSSKYYDPGHIKRIDLLKFLENKEDIEIDIYNQDNKHNFKNYKGKKTPYVDKSEGILNYKYYLMIENNFERNFITEKIWEPILCETLVFYYGCPNITDYIDKDAFVLLDINDFEKSYQIIKTAIEEDWWSQRIDIIRKEKEKILNNYCFFPTIENIIKIKKHIYIHVCCINNWKEIFDKLLQDIHTSGLYDIINDIRCNVLTENNENVDYIKEKDFKIKIIGTDVIESYEKSTLDILLEDSKKETFYVLYIHTKGVKHNNTNICVTDWVEYLTYFNIYKYTKCIKELENYDTIGVNLIDVKDNIHYSGNFWWSKSEYIQTLDKCKNENYNSPEFWITEKKTGKYLSLWNSNVNHYNTRYTKEIYN